MLTIIKNELKCCWKTFILWLAVILVLGGMGAWKYGAVAANTSLSAIVAGIPEPIRVFFGMYRDVSIDTPGGYFVCLSLWYTMVLCCHAVAVGGSMVLKELECRTAGFIFTKPISRTNVILSKSVLAVGQLLGINLFTWLLNLICLAPQTGGEIVILINTTMVGLFFTQLIFLAIGFFISSLASTKEIAIKIGLSLVLVFYLVSVAVEFFSLPLLAFATPFWYFNALNVVRYDSFSAIFLLPTVVIVAIGMILAVNIFKKRSFIYS